MRRFLGKLTALVMLAAASLAVLGVIGLAEALAQQHQSFVRIGETGNGNARQMTLGLNKSMIIDLPRAVRDVVISNPEQMEAVLQTSTRAYLIGKKTGEANVIFIDKDGRQVAILEVTIERDFSALSAFIGRTIPSANVKVDSLNGSIVLTGTVQNPIDATRAGEIAEAFVAKGQAAGTKTASQTQTSTENGGDSGQSTANGGSTTTQVGATEGGQVINMITVEGREQVLLKVSVVEMERNIVKQFGVDLGALVNSGSFAFAALSKLPFPLGTQGGGVIAPFLPNSVVGAGEAGGLGSPVGVSPGVAGGGVQWMSGESWCADDSACS